MAKRDMQIFVSLNPDVREHPEMLLTSGLTPYDAFNGT